MDDFRLGNQFLCLPWEGSAGGADYRNQALENFLAAKKSAYMGLTVDLSDASSLVAAITSVRGEYHPQMYNGMYTEALYNEYISKLKSAGIDDYVAIYQNAVSEFMK